MERICSIIDFSRVKKTSKKRRVNFILNKKLKYYTKEILKYFNIVILACGFIIAIILIKYKPMYKVSIEGKKIGYVENKQALEEIVKENITEKEEKNIDNISIMTTPEYELKLVDKTIKTEEEQMIAIVEPEVSITYKYYDIALNNETINSVDTKEEAEQLIQNIKEKNQEQELELSMIEKYTDKEEDVKTIELEVAKIEAQEKITQKLKEVEKQKQEERINNMPSINGIKLAYVPVSGTITSRYGVSSRIRKSNHTGLDIAAPSGTAIKAINAGTVICAKYSGSYGNLVKIDHGNGIETWYAHTSKMYVKEGQKVEAGSVIATVGSTGNSTGAHLHLEIRVNGTHVNPQNYLYK